LLQGATDVAVVKPAARDSQPMAGAQGCSPGGSPFLLLDFSLGPLIVIAIAIAGFVFGTATVQTQVVGALHGLLGDSGTQAIDPMLKGANKPREGILATVIGTGTLVFAAVGVVVQLKDALNTVWEVETPPGSGIWRFVRTYIWSLAGVLSLGFLL
jgi:membrane protein